LTTITNDPRDFIYELLTDDPERLRRLMLANPSFAEFNKLAKLKVSKDDKLVILADSSYEGSKPTIIANGGHSAAVIAYGLWLFTRELYLESDRADLSAWLDEGLPFELGNVSKRDLISISKTPRVTSIKSANYSTLGVIHS